MSVSCIAASRLPTPYGEFVVHGFAEESTSKEHVALSMGNLRKGGAVLTRVHSECLTGDALFSMRCDCGIQLQAALQSIADEGRGLLLYLRQEGRGIGLLNKIRAYQLQDDGLDTVEANKELGFAPDIRQYDICKVMLDYLHVTHVRLMTNNPDKVNALTHLGIQVTERIPHHIGRNPHNARYLATKAGKLGHLYHSV